MDLPDVNILITAHRVELPEHARARRWLENLVNGEAAYGMSELVLSGFLRIVTNPRVFKVPTPMKQALTFVEAMFQSASCTSIRPGLRHFRIFIDRCRNAGARGNLVLDAYFAALAIESGCRWITLDRDFARFPGLTWSEPPKEDANA